MEALVSYRMLLKLVKNGVDFLSVAELKVDDVGVWSVGDRLECLCAHCEEDVLHSKSIKVARYESFPADGFDCLLAGCFTELAFQFDVFHCCLI